MQSGGRVGFWQQFMQTGKIEDYLIYKNVQENDSLRKDAWNENT